MRKTSCQIISLMAGFLLNFVLTSSSLAHAQFASVTVSPPLVEKRVPPEKAYSGELTIHNNTDGDAVIMWEIVKLYLSQDESKNLAPYISIVEDMPILVEKKSRRIFHYHVQLPPDAEGEYDSMIFFKQVQDQKTMISVRFGVAMYFASEGTEQPDASVLSMKQSIGGQKEETTDVNFTVEIANIGNVHVRPKGHLEIRKEDRVVGRIKIRSGWPVFVNSSREYIYKWETNKNLEELAGDYHAKLVLNYGRIFKQRKDLTYQINFSIKNE